MRSLLFVPGDSQKKLDKSLLTNADTLILDLEDSVAYSEKRKARKVLAGFLASHTSVRERPAFYVRVNAIGSGLADDDLDDVMPFAPEGIMLPKAIGGRDIRALDERLTVLEKQYEVSLGSTRILPVATETAAAVLALSSIPGITPRLSGITWGGEDLAADIGAESNQDSAGSYTATYVLARSMALLTAVAAQADPIDTAFTNFGDTEAFEADCKLSRRDGFVGRIAVHPNQVDVINRVYTPSEQVVAHARKIVGAFSENPGMGTVGIDGQMIDLPHLRQAERILKRHQATGDARSA